MGFALGLAPGRTQRDAGRRWRQSRQAGTGPRNDGRSCPVRRRRRERRDHGHVDEDAEAEVERLRGIVRNQEQALKIAGKVLAPYLARYG
jgi:hypothetical protein